MTIDLMNSPTHSAPSPVESCALTKLLRLLLHRGACTLFQFHADVYFTTGLQIDLRQQNGKSRSSGPFRESTYPNLTASIFFGQQIVELECAISDEVVRRDRSIVKHGESESGGPINLM